MSYALADWEWKLRDHSNQLSPRRELSRVMFPAEMRRLWERFLHPRFWSVKFHRDRWGDRIRNELGLGPHGTIFVAGIDSDAYEEFGVVPAGYLPYYPVLPKYMIEELARQKALQTKIITTPDDFKPSELDLHHWPDYPIRGWRSLLHDAVKGGYLRPSETLSDLIGVDSLWLSLSEGWWT